MTVPPDPNTPNSGGQSVPPSGPPTPPPPPGAGTGQPTPPSFPGGGSVPPPPGSSGPGGGYDPNAYDSGVPENNKKALWSMILGIVGMICCGILAGIPAIILAVSARKEILASGGRQTGSGMATAGLILGIIAVVVSITYWILIATGTVPNPLDQLSEA